MLPRGVSLHRVSAFFAARTRESDKISAPEEGLTHASTLLCKTFAETLSLAGEDASLNWKVFHIWLCLKFLGPCTVACHVMSGKTV